MSHSSMTPRQASLYKQRLAARPYVIDRSGFIPEDKLREAAAEMTRATDYVRENPIVSPEAFRRVGEMMVGKKR